MYLRDFYRFDRLLELDDELRPGRIVPADEAGRPEPALSFFTDAPALVFAVRAPGGLALGAGGALHRLGFGTRLTLDGAGAGRVLRVLSEASLNYS